MCTEEYTQNEAGTLQEDGQARLDAIFANLDDAARARLREAHDQLKAATGDEVRHAACHAIDVLLDINPAIADVLLEQAREAQVMRAYAAARVEYVQERADQLCGMVVDHDLEGLIPARLRPRWEEGVRLSDDANPATRGRGIAQFLDVLTLTPNICPALARALLAELQETDPYLAGVTSQPRQERRPRPHTA